MKTLSCILVSCCLFIATSSLYSQCPAVLTINIQTVVDANCPDNGVVTLGGNGVGNPGVIFSVEAGPSRVGVQQSSNTFNSLTAGVYTFRATCASQTAEVMVTVNNTYTPLNPNFSADVSNTCTNFTEGGTITVTGASGNGPLQYSFIKNNQANYNDALSVYSVSNTYTAATFGTYQVRVKDACGVFLTRTVMVQRDFGAVSLGGGSVYFDDMPCDSALLGFFLFDDSQTGVSLSGYPKVKFRVFEKDAGSCAPGALIKSFELTADSIQQFIIPRRDVFVETTTPCGDIRTNCYDYPDNDSAITTWKAIVKGCGTPGDPYTMTIRHLFNFYTALPATVRLYNNTTNALIQTSVITTNLNCCTVSNLPLDDYRIELTDACNHADTLIITAPAGAAAILPEGAGTLIDKECTFDNGKSTVKLALTGLISDLDIATITISSGPDNIGQSATLNPVYGVFNFYNLTPGATYGFTANSSCATTNLSFTIPAHDSTTLHFSMAPYVEQQCGGTGTVYAGINYDGFGNYNAELWQGGIKIAESNAGVFTNVLPGLYTVKGFSLQTYCSGTTSKELNDTVRIYDDATPPQLLRQYGYICESDGSQTALGKASVEVAGFGPYTYSLKQVSPSPDPDYTIVAANAPGNYTFDNLVAYAVYSLLITDNCGKSTVSELVIGNVGTLAFTNSFEPCVGNPYLLAAAAIPGASYQWVKNGDPLVLSTTKDLYFSSYNAAYDGRYDCTISLGGSCVQRLLSAQLTSANCGALLPVKLSSFYAAARNCKVELTWITTGAGSGIFEIERSMDGNGFYKVGTLNYNSNAAQTYTFQDVSPLDATNYYRLKIKGNNANPAYSKALGIVNICLEKKIRVSIYPNPVINNHAVLTIYADHNETADVVIINTNGRVLKQTKAAVRRGEGVYVLDLAGFPAGYYFVKVTTTSGFSQTVKVFRQ